MWPYSSRTTPDGQCPEVYQLFSPQQLHASSCLTRRQTRHTTIPLLPLRLKRDLHPKVLAIRIKPRPMLVLPAIHLPRLQLKRTRLVRLRRNQHVLEILVWGILDLLLVRAHEAHLGRNALRNLRELQLERQTLLPRNRIPVLRDLVTRSSDLNQILFDRDRVRARVALLGFLAHLRIFGGAAREVRLVLAALGVGEVGAIVLVDGETQATLEGADVVFEEVGVFVEVDGFEGEFAQALAAVGVGGFF